MNKPVVSAEGRATETWASIRKHLEERLLKLRARNDERKHDAAETAYLRGAIAEVKMMLRMDQDPVKVAQEDHFRD